MIFGKPYCLMASQTPFQTVKNSTDCCIKKIHENVLVKHVNPENQQLSCYSKLSSDQIDHPE